MKYKILIIILIGTLFTSIIYLNRDTKKINVLALGDGISTGMTPYHVEGYDYNDYLIENLNEEKNLNHYFKSFNEVDETASKLLIKINNNTENIDQKIKIKQAIKEADIITISLGMDELNNYASKNTLGSSKITGFLNQYEKVLKTIRKLNQNKIYMIGLYESNLISKSKITKINESLKTLALKYKTQFVDIMDISTNNEFYINQKNYYLNYKGQEYIYKKIKETMEQSTIKII